MFSTAQPGSVGLKEFGILPGKNRELPQEKLRLDVLVTPGFQSGFRNGNCRLFRA